VGGVRDLRRGGRHLVHPRPADRTGDGALNSPANEYRADVDGLRAVAILLVLVFHAFPAALGGGFVGVDVFFVISGYLISGIILAQLDRGRFTFRWFYARRVRRILPAMALVITLSLAFGWRVLWPAEYSLLGKHAAGAAASIANLLMWKEGSYFEPAATHQPLLHLWSLGIEEQFYFVWPVFLAVAWRRRWLSSKLILACLALSLLLNLELIALYAPRNAFYLPVTRFWELLIGAWLAWRAMPANRPAVVMPAAERNVMSFAGLAAVLASAALLDATVAFPGAWAIPPTVGTAMMIAAGPDSWLNRRVLALKPMVAVGLISYPIYLWHWPMLSFARILHGGPPAASVRAGIVVASVVAAALTYLLLEKPIRFGPHTSGRLVAIVLATMAAGAAGLMVRLDHGVPGRSEAAARVFDDVDLEETAITAPPCPRRMDSLGDCAIADSGAAPTAAIIGDSHARRLFLGLAPALKAQGGNLLTLSCSTCVPFYDVHVSTRPYASSAARIKTSLDFIATERSIRTVYIMSRGPAYLTGHGYGPADYVGTFRLLHAAHPEMDDNAQVFAEGLRTTVRRLRDAGKQVVFVDAVPELDFDPKDCFAPWPRERHFPCEVTVAQYQRRNAAYLALVRSVLREFPDVREFNPADYLCDQARCQVVRDGHIVYLDNNHISMWASAMLAAPLMTAAPAGTGTTRSPSVPAPPPPS
jgi:peptidoglycan/LPS O-acetylase OafA/YrhL